MLEAKLVVVGGDTKTHEIVLKQWPTLIGRSREAAVKLPHPLVSRNHCEIFEADGKLYVRDLGSLNGTYVGSERVQDPLCLEPNALLTIGTVTFRAIYQSNGATRELAAAEPSGRTTDSRADRKPPRVPPSAPPPLSDLWDTQAAPLPNHLQPAAAPVACAAHNDRQAGQEPAAEDPCSPSSLDLERMVIEDLDGPRAAAVYSHVAIDDSAVGSAGSVSLSALGQLPQPPSALSFAGGIHLPPDAPGAACVESRIVIHPDQGAPPARGSQAAAEWQQRPR